MLNLTSLSSNLFIGIVNLYFNFYLKKATHEVSQNYTKLGCSESIGSKDKRPQVRIVRNGQIVSNGSNFGSAFTLSATIGLPMRRPFTIGFLVVPKCNKIQITTRCDRLWHDACSSTDRHVSEKLPRREFSLALPTVPCVRSVRCRSVDALVLLTMERILKSIWCVRCRPVDAYLTDA